MSSDLMFRCGKELCVITEGPGTLYALSYAEAPKPDLPNNITYVYTERAGITKFLVSPAYAEHSEFLAVIWTGQGQAVWRIGESLTQIPVGCDWKHATTFDNVQQGLPSDVSRYADPLLGEATLSAGTITTLTDEDKQVTSDLLFRPGKEVCVITNGPGTLYALSFDSKSGLPPNITYSYTEAGGITKFMVSAAYSFRALALIWSGHDEAVYQIGHTGSNDSKVAPTPVGRKWELATCISYDYKTLTVGNCSGMAGPLMKDATLSAGTITKIPHNLEL